MVVVRDMGSVVITPTEAITGALVEDIWHETTDGGFLYDGKLVMENEPHHAKIGLDNDGEVWYSKFKRRWNNGWKK